MASSTRNKTPKPSAAAQPAKPAGPAPSADPMKAPRYTAWHIVGVVVGVLALVTLACMAGVGIGMGVSRTGAAALLGLQSFRPSTASPMFPRGQGVMPWNQMPYGQMMPFDDEQVPQGGTAYLGVAYDVADNGAAVTQVIQGSPADAAGLKVGDVIHAVDDTVITQANQLRRLIQLHQPGDKVSLTILRNDGSQTIVVTLGSAPANQ
jgi:S1-C subfamily serine protease